MEHLEKEGWAFFDLTFDNFADVEFSFQRYRQVFEVGEDGS